MILFPPAKINLGLRVLHKREDGYHEIETCMIPIPFFDVLELLKSPDFTFRQTGLSIEGNTGSNLCVRAYELLKSKCGIPPVYMHLRKELPMGAGLGGGSSDAAYVLRGLNDLFELGLSLVELESLASVLGSDCPFFIRNEAQLARGRGELLSRLAIDLKGYYLKLVNPGIHVGTKEAYAGVVFNTQKEALSDVLSAPIEDWKEKLTNDFEVSVFRSHPVLQEIKRNLYAEGAVYAAMSGSGSTMFGIYAFQPKESFGASNYLEKVLAL